MQDIRSRRILALLNLPAYESKKGTSASERALVLRDKAFCASVCEHKENRVATDVEAENVGIENYTCNNKLFSKAQDHINLNNTDNVTNKHRQNRDDKQSATSENSKPFLTSEPKANLALTDKDHLNLTSTTGLDKNKSVNQHTRPKQDTESYIFSDSDSEPKTSGSEYVPSEIDSSSDVEQISSISAAPSVSLLNKKAERHNHNCISPALNKEVSSTEMSSSSSKKTKQKVKIHNIVVVAPADSTNFEADPTNAEQNTNYSLLIDAAKKSKSGRRIRDKYHSCYFCQKQVIHMAKHLETAHGDELEIAKALAYPKGSKGRKMALLTILRAGDFYHNCDCISLKKGELILVRRPSAMELKLHKYNDYGPCPNCLGFMLKKHLWHHIKNCDIKRHSSDEKGDQVFGERQIIAESNAILFNVFGTEYTLDYKENILRALRDDDVGSLCKEDMLILRFGAMLYEKYGNTQSELTRQSMRQLSRLLLKIREISGQKLWLADLLKPEKYDLIISGVKDLCGRTTNESHKRPEFATPSLALKVGHSLKKCANIERGVALRKENLKRNEQLISFIHLMDLEWQSKISSNALSTLHMRKLNAGQLLPLTSDLKRVNEYVIANIRKYHQIIQDQCNEDSWQKLAKFVLCRIILFNKRRAGEASKMTIEQYSSRPLWSEQANEELKSSLTSYELKLAERLCVVSIIGKRGQKVPVILTKEAKESIDLLLKYRKLCGISENNPYIFARGKQADTNMRGTDALRQIVSELKLEKPSYITGTKLRKYVATVCQIFDLTENEHDWLARHLGHDIRVHREYYRLHEDAVELTKVSRLLLAIDNGQASKFVGKQLNDIELKDLPGIEEDDEEEEGELEEKAEQTCPGEKFTSRLDKKHYEDNQPASSSKPEYRPQKQNDVQKKTLTGKSCKKRPWAAEEKEAVFKHFKINIKKGIVPGKEVCEGFQKQYPNLQDRKWTDIKFCVKNQISKVKKLKL